MTYEHYKGGRYKIICASAWNEADKTRVVVYQGIGTGTIWVRPYDEFHGYVDIYEEDVENMDVPKVIGKVKRFTAVSDYQ